MENWTVYQYWLVAAAVLGGISLILTTTNLIVKSWKQAKAPEVAQNERITKLEKEVEDINRKLDSDFSRLNEQTESSRLSQEALLALLDHALSGNNVEQMQKAKDKLREHLIHHA